MPDTTDAEIIYITVNNEDDFPEWIDRNEVIHFFHETMKLWNDSVEDIQRGLDYAFSDADGEGGFLLLASENKQLVGALLMLKTGMKGYVPENLLVFVSVDPSQRGKGLGTKIIEKSIAESKGDIKLHVDYPNPAKRLYERLGFENKYAEMRLKR